MVDLLLAAIGWLLSITLWLVPAPRFSRRRQARRATTSVAGNRASVSLPPNPGDRGRRSATSGRLLAMCAYMAASAFLAWSVPAGDVIRILALVILAVPLVIWVAGSRTVSKIESAPVQHCAAGERSKPAPLSQRIAARSVDTAIWIAALAVVMFAVGSTIELDLVNRTGGRDYLIVAAVFYGVPAAYEVLTPLVLAGQSIGKRGAGLVVLGLDGSPATAFALAVRTAPWAAVVALGWLTNPADTNATLVLMSFGTGLVLFASALTVLNTAADQGVWDLVARTKVVDGGWS